MKARIRQFFSPNGTIKVLEMEQGTVKSGKTGSPFDNEGVEKKPESGAEYTLRQSGHPGCSKLCKHGRGKEAAAAAKVGPLETAGGGRVMSIT